MRILHCVASLDPVSGGPARSVPQLALALAAQGVDVGLWSPGAVAGGLPDLTRNAHALIRVLSGDFTAALDAFGPPDVVHDHGIWLPCHREVARVCRERGIPRIVSPRGMLEPWALNHKKWKKRLAWWLYQKRDLQSAAALHATAESEAAQLRMLGFGQRIIVAANGVGGQETGDRGQGTAREVPAGSLAASRSPDHSLPFKIQDQSRTALFLSRIHPIKGLSLWLEAWDRVRPAGWCMQIVGPDEGGHVKELKQLCDKLGLGYVSEETGDRNAGRALANLENHDEVEAGMAGDKQETGDRRQETGDRRQETGDRRQETGDRNRGARRFFIRPPIPDSRPPTSVPCPLSSDPRSPTPDPRSLSPVPCPLFPILFSGPIEGQAKWEMMGAADLFVLPTHSENFGIVVAEALACGVPVITTTGAPWAGLLDHRCGWWVDVTVDALAGALEAAIALTDDERAAMGQRGREWMLRDFGWSEIARRMIAGYEEVVGL